MKKKTFLPFASIWSVPESRDPLTEIAEKMAAAIGKYPPAQRAIILSGIETKLLGDLRSEQREAEDIATQTSLASHKITNRTLKV